MEIVCDILFEQQIYREKVEKKVELHPENRIRSHRHEKFVLQQMRNYFSIHSYITRCKANDDACPINIGS